MVMPRPLSALRPAIFEMADAAQRANITAVKESTRKLERYVTVSGSRYRLRGRNGKRVPLSAMSDVKVYGDISKPVGVVRGIPEGFWNIVEYGSGPHLITSQKNRAGQGRTTRSGRTAGRFYTPGKVMRLYSEGESLGALRPMPLPYGFRQFARHPGHGSIGRPWRLAMEAGAPAVADTLEYEQFKAQSRAFLNTI